jgi:hypothetical protein
LNKKSFFVRFVAGAAIAPEVDRALSQKENFNAE